MGIDLIFKIAAIGLLTAIVNQVLKKADKDEIATLTTLAGLVIVLLMVVDLIAQLFDTLDDIRAVLMDIVKIAAAGVITAVCALILRETRADMAIAVTLAGGVIVLLMVLTKVVGIFIGVLRR